MSPMAPFQALTRAALSGLVDDRASEGVFRINRRIFTDQRIFDLEMKHLFEIGVGVPWAGIAVAKSP